MTEEIDNLKDKGLEDLNSEVSKSKESLTEKDNQINLQKEVNNITLEEYQKKLNESNTHIDEKDSQTSNKRSINNNIGLSTPPILEPDSRSYNTGTENSDRSITTNKIELSGITQPTPLFYKSKYSNPITPGKESSRKNSKDPKNTIPQAIINNKKTDKGSNKNQPKKKSGDNIQELQKNIEMMAIINELKINFENRIEKLESENQELHKNVYLLEIQNTTNENRASYNEDNLKELQSSLQIQHQPNELKSNEIKTNELQANYEERIENLESENKTLQKKLYIIDIQNSSNGNRVSINEEKLKEQEILCSKILLNDETIANFEKQNVFTKDALESLQDTHNKKIVSLQYDLEALNQLAQTENDQNSEMEKRLEKIENCFSEIEAKIKKNNKEIVDSEQVMNATKDIRNINDKMLEKFNEFEKKTDSQFIKIKAEISAFDKKFKSNASLQIDFNEANTDSLNTKDYSFLKQLVPGLIVKVRELKHENSKNHDFLNYGLRAIEQTCKEMQESHSIVRTYQTKLQINKLVQRLFILDSESRMKVYSYNEDDTSFEYLTRPNDLSVQIISVTRSHDNLNLFVGTTSGIIEQYSLNKPKQILFEQIFDSEICYMKCSYDNLHQFVIDLEGSIIKWSIPEKRELNRLEKIHDFKVVEMTLSQGSSHLFTCDIKCGIKQFSIKDFELVRCYKTIFEDSPEDFNGPSYLELTHDSKYLIICDSTKKSLYIISTINKKSEYDFSDVLSKIHPSGLDCIYLVNNRLYVSSNTGIITEISIKNKKIKNNYPITLENGILIMLPNTEGTTFFISDNIGNLIEWSLENRKVTKYYGRAHSVQIDFMGLSIDKNYLITKDIENCVKYWHIESKRLIKNIGYPTDDKITAIFSIKK